MFKTISDMPVSFYYLIGRVVTAIGQIVLIRVLTAVLVPSELGKYYLLIATASWFSLLIINPVSVYVSRHIYPWNEEKVAVRAVRYFVVYVMFVALLTSLVLLLLYNFRVITLQTKIFVFGLFIPLFVFFTFLSGFWPNLLNLLHRRLAFVFFSSSNVWGKIVIILLSTAIISHTAETVFLGIILWAAVLSLLSGMYLWLHLKKPSKPREVSSYSIDYRELFKFAWPLAIAVGLYWGQSQGYRFVLKYTSGMAVVGKFVVAYSLGAALVTMVESLFNQIYQPIYYKEIAPGTKVAYREAWTKLAEYGVGVYVPLGVFAACAGPYLGKWLLAPAYRDMGIYAAFGALSELFRGFSSLSYLGFVAKKDTLPFVLRGAIGTLIAIVGVWSLSKMHPLLGTGCALVLSNMVVSVALYLRLKKDLAVSFPWRKMVASLALTLPVLALLILGYKFDLNISSLSNLVVLFSSGLMLLFSQWKLSKDLWFERI